MLVTKHPSWYVIWNRILLSDHERDSQHINIHKTSGPDILYGHDDDTVICYPGEYEIDEIIITALADSSGGLNYKIKLGDQMIGYIQHPKVVNNHLFDHLDVCLYEDEVVLESLMKNDIDGEKLNLTTLSV